MKQETGSRSIQYSASRPTSHGREGFSIDAARLAAYRRHKDGFVGVSRKADERLRAADNALSTAKINAGRIAGRDAEQKAYYQKALVEARREYDAAEKEMSTLDKNAQALLSIVDRIEKYVADQRWNGVVSAHSELEKRHFLETREAAQSGAVHEGEDE